MSTLSEQTLLKRFGELNNTQQSVQTLSKWLIHYRKRAKFVVEVWYKEVKKEKSSRKLINLLYVCNDVVQTSKRKDPEYAQEFANFLDRAFGHIARHADDKSIKAMKRILHVWKERGIYDSQKLDKWSYCITSNLNKQNLMHFKQEDGSGSITAKAPSAGRKGSSNRHSASAKRAKTEDSSLTPQAQVAESVHTPIAKLLKASPKSNTGSDSPLDVDPPTSDKLLEMISSLNNAPSTDALIREEISRLPLEVADVTKLDSLTTRKDADDLSQVVNHAFALLNSYNTRLSGELGERTVMMKNLRAYLQSQKDKSEQDAVILEQWQKRLEKLGSDREELKRHVDSLPDLSKADGPLPPLPALGDLFSS